MRDLGQELDESLIYTRSSNHQVPLHLQLACFDGTDSSYMKHRDNATGPATSLWALGVVGYLQARPYRKRVVTAILYLNDQDWQCDKSGGALRMHLGADQNDDTGASASHMLNIAPAGGTLVLFDSKVSVRENL